MVLTGTFEHTIDSKHRVAIPAEMRAQIARAAQTSDSEPLRLYVTLGEEGALVLYTEAEFDKRAQQLDQADMDDDELLQYERLIFSLARSVETDKQGRIRLPEQLLKYVELGTDVVLIGVKDHIEIRARGEWDDQITQLIKQRHLIMNPRRALRKRRPPGNTPGSAPGSSEAAKPAADSGSTEN